MTLDAWIEDHRRLFEVPGLAVGVLQDGKTVLSQGFGVRDVEADSPVTPDTAFAIASATKAFTAATVASLVDEGVLDWDRPGTPRHPQLPARRPRGDRMHHASRPALSPLGPPPTRWRVVSRRGSDARRGRRATPIPAAQQAVPVDVAVQPLGVFHAKE